MSDFLLSQILVCFVVLANFSAFQCRNRTHLQLLLSLGSALMAWHFFLLAKDTAGWMMLLSAVRFSVSIRWRSRPLAALFIAGSLGFTIYSFQGALSLLSGSANLCSTSGSFCKTDRNLRRLILAASGFWLIHNTLAMTPMGVFVEMLFFGSSLLGYYRFYIRRSPYREAFLWRRECHVKMRT